MKVKPRAGFVIRDPDLHDFLPEEGREVPAADYWIRRLGDGDVVLVDDSAPEAGGDA